MSGGRSGGNFILETALGSVPSSISGGRGAPSARSSAVRQRHLEPSVGTKEEPETALRGLCNPFVLCGVQVHWENSEAPSKQKGTRATTESTPFCERFPAATPGSRRSLPRPCELWLQGPPAGAHVAQAAGRGRWASFSFLVK